MITLVRHGPSVSPSLRGLILRDDMLRWRAGYDIAGIQPDGGPSLALRQIAANATHILASDLRRGIESAERLAPNRVFRQSDLLREAELPIPYWPTRLPFAAWATIISVQWMCRCAIGTDATEEDLARAHAAADMLVELSSVVVVTHGVFRRLLANELLRRGWTTAGRVGGYQNWSHWTFNPPATTP